MSNIIEYLYGFKVFAFNSVDELACFSIKNPGIYISINAECLYKKDANFINIVNDNYGFSDGVGPVLASSLNGNGVLKKLPGCELWLSVLDKLETGKVAFLGSTTDTMELLVNKIKYNYPHLDIVFYNDGYFSSEKEIIERLVESKPEFVFIGMGQPKQEVLSNKLKQQLLNAKLYPLGGAFDLYTGKVKRAPKWLVNLGLESIYRLYLEPSRWRRQIVLPKFLFRCVLDRLFR